MYQPKSVQVELVGCIVATSVALTLNEHSRLPCGFKFRNSNVERKTSGENVIDEYKNSDWYHLIKLPLLLVTQE